MNIPEKVWLDSQQHIDTANALYANKDFISSFDTIMEDMNSRPIASSVMRSYLNGYDVIPELKDELDSFLFRINNLASNNSIDVNVIVDMAKANMNRRILIWINNLDKSQFRLNS